MAALSNMLMLTSTYDPPSPTPSPRRLLHSLPVQTTSTGSPSFSSAAHLSFPSMFPMSAFTSSSSHPQDAPAADAASKGIRSSKKTPSKRKTKAAAASSSSTPSRSSTSTSKMDQVLNSQVPTDHDNLQQPLKEASKANLKVPSGATKPKFTTSISITSLSASAFSAHPTATQTSSQDVTGATEISNVLLTPRRGRRLGGIDMGWDSPVQNDSEQTASHPHTLPKANRTLRGPVSERNVAATPTKRKASAAFAQNPERPQKALVDNEGWASAAMLSKVPLTEASGSPGFSPRAAESSTNATPAKMLADSRDPFANFSSASSSTTPITPRLIPIEVAGLGRVAVPRDVASQMVQSGSSAPSSPHLGFSGRASDSEASSIGSSLGASTNPTSVGTPCPLGTSPVFSHSKFLASEPSSPVKETHPALYQGYVAEPNNFSPSAQDALREIIQRSPGFAVRTKLSTDSLDNECWRPRLGGSQATTTAALPSLDWPDCPTGPWAAAGQHIDGLKQQRKEGILKWLEEDLDEDELPLPAGAFSSYQHHPMVAKVLLDRARKQQMYLLASSSASTKRTSATPRKRSKKSVKDLAITPSKRGRKPKKTAPESSFGRRSVATAASLARSDGSFIRGCKCGIEDEAIIMVQCDHCRRWLHLPCVGISNVDDLDDEWYCDDCCSSSHHHHHHQQQLSLTPATISSLADLSTPEGVQAAISMCEPVFALPSGGTPIQHRGAALSSSIALAPSPPMFSIGKVELEHKTPSAKRSCAGRSRAERVGWRTNEPGSPLARKSTTASSGIRATMPETPSKMSETHAPHTFEASTPSLLAGFSRADWEPVRTRDCTPSPKLVGMTTPSRHASARGRKTSHSYADEAADIFSTPSRFASGGSWGSRRHQRMDSFTGGATPLFDSSAYSGMPSLVYSSGGADDLVDTGYNLARAWQLQSPTSTTRAVAAQSQSKTRGLRTPELQPRLATGSGARDPATSSSPFPRTPTFGDLGIGFPSNRLAKASTATSSADRNKNRQVSGEVPLGLGLGFDLDDVLDWS